MPTNFTPTAEAKPVWPTVLVTVILTAVVAGGVTYWLVSQSFNERLAALETVTPIDGEPMAIPLTDPANPAATATKSNKYTSTDYKFSFSYDPDWTATETKNPTSDNRGIPLTVNLDPKDTNRTLNTDQPSAAEVIVYKKLSDLNKNDYGDKPLDAKIKTVKQYLDAAATLSSPVYTDIKQVTVGNTKAWRTTAGPDQIGGGVKYFMDAGDDGVDIIAIWVRDETDEHGNIILSSFELN